MKPKILLIDDEQVVHENLKFVYNKKYDFESIYNKVEFTNRLEEGFENIDLVILDLNLNSNKKEGYKEGLENINKIRKIDKNVPIVILTNTNSDVINQLIVGQRGANSCYYKSEYENSDLNIPINLFIKKKNLLFIDDDRDFLNNVKFAFGNNAFNCYLAKDLSEANEILEEDGIDLILLDLDLGEGLTFDILNTLKNKYPTIPIIVITNANTDDEQQIGLKVAQNKGDNCLNKNTYNHNKWLNTFYSTIDNGEAKALRVVAKIEKENVLQKAYYELKKENLELLDENLSIIARNDRSEEGKIAIEKLKKVKSHKKFKNNLSRKLILRGIEVENIGDLDTISWKLDERVNIIIGENGSGKSLLLRIAAAMAQSSNIAIKKLKLQSTSLPKMKITEGINKELFKNNIYKTNSILDIEESIGKIPVLAIADIRYVNKDDKIPKKSRDYKSLVTDGAYYFLEGEAERERLLKFLDRLGEKAVKNDDENRHEIFTLLERVVNNLNEVADDDEKNKFKFGTVIEVENSYYEVPVITETGIEIPIQYASRGELSILSMFGLVYQYLENLQSHRSEKASSIAKEHGIVIIDEIDAHLHPKWQRKIISLFLEAFPNVQFIFMAHSPHVVAGRKAGEVVKLELNKENKKYKLTRFNENFIGDTPDEVLESAFDLEPKELFNSLVEYEKIWKELPEDIKKKLVEITKKPNYAITREDELFLDSDEKLKKALSYNIMLNKFDAWKLYKTYVGNLYN